MLTITKKPLLYNPFDPALRADPYPIYRRLRETDPVHRSPLGFWVISRYADVVAVQRDTSLGFFSARAMRRAENVGDDLSSPVAKVARRWLLFTDQKRHQRFRGLMGRYFTPRALEALRPRITAVAGELLDRLPTDRPVDLVEEFARPFPISVLCAWLDLPDEDRAQCHRWSASIGRILESVLHPETIRSLSDVVLECDDYLRAKLDERRRAPGDDLLSSLLGSKFGGEPMSEDELVASVSLLFGAAYETTVNLIANGTLALIRNPDQLELLRAEPSLIVDAVEELLRYDSSAQLHGRWTFQDLEIDGTVVPPGCRVIILMGSANRDPDRFPDPDRLDLRRPDVRSTSFGAGIHHCLGAGLARLETQIAITLLLERFARIGPVTGPLEWRPEHVAIRALKSLPVELSRR